MITGKHIFAIDSHTMGEATRVVIGGIGPIPGPTVAEKKKYLAENIDNIRTMLMHEPRGHRDMFGAILLEPTDKRADLGIVFMNSRSYLNMCGHGSIGAITTVLEMGLFPMTEPFTKIVLETPAGIVYGTAAVNNGAVKNVIIQNVPSFLYRQDILIDIPDIGTVPVDIAFGGNFFALVSVEKLGLEIIPQQLHKLVEIGMYIREQLNQKVEVVHPLLPYICSIDLVELFSPPHGSEAHARNVTVFGDKQFDRSPCGTGTSAKLATLYAKGKLALGQDFIYESIIGTTFKGRVINETKVGNISAVVTEISGRAFITGIQQFVYNPDDSLKFGFLV